MSQDGDPVAMVDRLIRRLNPNKSDERGNGRGNGRDDERGSDTTPITTPTATSTTSTTSTNTTYPTPAWNAFEEFVLRDLHTSNYADYNWRTMMLNPALSLQWWIHNFAVICRASPEVYYNDGVHNALITSELFIQYIDSPVWRYYKPAKLYDRGIITDDILIKHDPERKIQFILDIQNMVGLDVLRAYADKIDPNSLNNPRVNEEFILEVGVDKWKHNKRTVLEHCSEGVLTDNWDLLFPKNATINLALISKISESLICARVARADFDKDLWDMNYLSQIIPYEFVAEYPNKGWIRGELSKSRITATPTVKSASKGV